MAADDLRKIGGISAARLALSMLRDPIRCMEDYYRAYGPAIAIEGFMRPPERRTRAMLLVGPKFNRHVFANFDLFRPLSLFAVPAAKGTAQSNLQRGFLASYGAEHQAVAKVTLPHLARARVEGYFERIKKIALEDIGSWPTGVTVDLYSLVQQFGHHVALQLVFGEDDPARRADFARLLADYHIANWSPFAFLFPFDVAGSPYHRLMRSAEALQDFIGKWVEEQRNAPPDKNLKAVFAHMKDPDGNPLSVGKIAAHVSFFGFAAYETMSSALTWALIFLALHPQVRLDLLDELDEAGPIEGLDYPTLSALPLLDAVIKETLRLVPPTPSLPFKALEASEVDGIALRRGVQVVLSPHLTHRMPDIYDEPKQFRPERWFSINPTPFEYLPFSGGKRFCPGYWLAVEWLKIGIATALPRFRISMQPGGALDREFRGITMPKQDIPIVLVPQDRAAPAERHTGTLFDLVAQH